MLKRKMLAILEKWRGEKGHKCLVVKGQRQVGKTYIIRRFGEEYENFIELNFIERTELKDIFRDDLRTDSIISKMKLYFDDKKFVPGKTLIFLDEIQDCKAARTSLKFFTEDGRYDVICSGSNLGLENGCSLENDNWSIPVGYETVLTMNGLDFEEFLWASGVDDEAIHIVRSAIADKREIPSAYNTVFSSRFRDFMVVGGMPMAVQRYIDTKDYNEAREVILGLVESAKSDINRYNTGVDRIKAAECFDSIPYQLDQTNKKFMYSRINGGGSRKSAEKYMDNLLWIKAAGYADFCHSLYGLGKPIQRFRDSTSFRVYLSDTGMLTNLYGKNTVKAILGSDYSYNMGAVVENAVAECLSKSGHELYYYNKTGGEGRMEIDFIIEGDIGSVAIEVKSGKSRNSPSIDHLSDDSIAERIMLRDENISEEKAGIIGYPIFASAFIDDIVNQS